MMVQVKVVNDNVMYAKCVVRMGLRNQAKEHDFSDILGDDNMEKEVKVRSAWDIGKFGCMRSWEPSNRTL
jgi:hypothetical protein